MGYSRGSYDQASRLEEVERVKNSHKGPKPGKRVHGRRWPKVLACILVLLVVLGGLGAFAGYSLYKDVKAVQADAQQVMGVADTVKKAVKGGDSSQIAPAMEKAADAAKRMDDTTHGTLWNLAALVPVYGEDVRSAQTMTATLDDLAQNGLVPLGNSLSGVSVSSLIGDDGTIDVATMQHVVGALQEAAPVIHSANDTIQALPQAHIGKVRELVAKAQGQFSSIDNAVSVAEGIAPYVPQLFGANGQTATYLVTAQNTAEIRATGGFPGSVGIITVTDGKMAIGEFESIYKFYPEFSDIDLGINDEEVAAYDWGAINTRDNIGDASFSPDFTRAADIWARAYAATHDGEQVTAVLGVNPVFLQNMMKLTGQSVDVGGTSINGGNVGKTLMRDAYRTLTTDQQDAFFSAVAGQVFSGMMSSLGKVGVADLMQFVTDNASAGNLRVSFMNDEIAKAMSGMKSSGIIPDNDPTEPIVGVYYNDLTYSKMGWYVSIDNQVGTAIKNADGTTTYQVTSAIKNNLTGEELATAPQYVYGYNEKKRDKGDMVFNAYLTVPAGGSISNISASTESGDTLSMSEYAVDGHTMFKGEGNLASGETMTITYTVTVSAQAEKPLIVYNTPTAQKIAGWGA